MSAKLVWFPVVAIAATGLAACDRTNVEPSLFRTITSETASLATDAKQRVIINRARYEPPNDEGSLNNRQICAEPSPDVTQAFSAALKITASLSTAAAGATGGDQSLSAGFGFANSFASSVAQLGERLAVIQLFRDRMYRACEAFANGAIDEVAYTLMLARNDKTMATLLTTEMAAGAFGRSLAQLGGSASTAGVDPEERAKPQKEIDDLTGQLSEIAKSDKSKADREKAAEPVTKQLAEAHTKLLALDLAAARTSALSNVVGSAPGSISNRADASGLVGLSSQIAGIHQNFIDDPGLEPLTDACLTSLSILKFKKRDDSDLFVAGQSSRIEALIELSDERRQEQQEYENTIERLKPIIESDISQLSEGDKIFLVSIGAVEQIGPNKGEITSKSVQETMDLLRIRLDEAMAQLRAEADVKIRIANEQISEAVLRAGSPFAAFCVKDVFGALEETSYLRTMIRARKELRAASRPTDAEVKLKQLEICQSLTANLKDLDTTKQDKVLAMCRKPLS